MYTIKVIISQQADYVKIYIMMSQYLSEGYKSHAIKNKNKIRTDIYMTRIKADSHHISTLLQ